MYPSLSPPVLGSDHWHHTQGWSSAKGILSQFKFLPATGTPNTLHRTTPPRNQGPDKTHVHMHPSWSPRVLGSDHWYHAQCWPSAKGILSQFKSLPPTATPNTLQGTTPPRETGTRQDPHPHVNMLIPSNSRLRSLALYSRMVLCQRNPLPIQIPPIYNHSWYPTGDHSSQETGTRQDPCSHVPELIPSSFRQYRMNTPAKVVWGASRIGPCVKVPQGIWTFVNPQRFEVVWGDFGQRHFGGSCVAYVKVCWYQMLAAPGLDLWLQKVLLENKQLGSARQESDLDDPDCVQWVSKQTSTE